MAHALVSSLAEFSALMKPIDHYRISECEDVVGYELYLLGPNPSASSDDYEKYQILAKVGTCRGETRIFKTLDSIRAWLMRNNASPFVDIRCDLRVFDSESCGVGGFEAFRCRGCGKAFQAAYTGAPVCKRCASSLSLECDARTE